MTRTLHRAAAAAASVAAAAALAAACMLAAGPATAAIVVPEGTPITGLLDGTAAGIGGLAGGYTPGDNVTPLADAAFDIEFVTADAALAIDLTSDGLLRIWDNRDDNAAGLTHVLRFSFAGLAQPLGALALEELAAAAGSVELRLVDGATVEVALRGLRLDALYGHFDLRLASVDEPAPLAAVALALAVLARMRRRPR